MCGHSGTQRLTEGNDRFWVNPLRGYKPLIGRFSIAIKACLAGISFTAAVSPILQGEHVGRRTTQKFIDRRAVRNIASIAVKGQKCELCPLIWNPPSLEPDAIRRS